MLPEEKKQMIRELSPTHYIDEIAAIVGCSKPTVMREQERAMLSNVKRMRKRAKSTGPRKPLPPPRKYITTEQKEMMKQLSATHLISEIAKEVGCSKETVRSYLSREKGIVPKSKVKRSSEVKEGYFDVDEFLKQYAW